ncbi:hmx1p [Saccharomyces arboricola H-6]|uniref:Hmx1p n=1 Tax=Saccharomyces arboricola (strain H-6 / AS 2.3317 / CBS 10644) TaxID=1160507 RepID=J8Q519_SACAR|nr:hmx1p [Saccharomyces arboricola H-6]
MEDGTNTTIIPSPTDVGALANRINFRTRDAHNKINTFMGIKLAIAMRHGFIYRQGILAYYYVFDAIEQEIDRLLNDAVTEKELQASAILKQFWLEDFRRSTQIYKDLKLLYSNLFKSTESLNEFLATFEKPPLLQQFVNDIHENIRREPCTILSYCHVLYLALFAGGRLIRSNLYRRLGLFPNFEKLSQKELVKKGTNFFTFSDLGPTEETRLKWEYKKNYELATRTELTEAQKLQVISVAEGIFDWNFNIVAEIGELNRRELMSKFSFKCVTYVYEEWMSDKDSATRKAFNTTVLLVVSIVAIWIFYLLLRKNFLGIV